MSNTNTNKLKSYKYLPITRIYQNTKYSTKDTKEWNKTLQIMQERDFFVKKYVMRIFLHQKKKTDYDFEIFFSYILKLCMQVITET